MSTPAESRRARVVLAVMAASFSTFLWFYVPRLNNYVLSDREFTGWTGPIAERIAGGERPYIDFVLPIPPGGMVVLAAIQKLAGQALLIQELWVAGVSQLLLGLIAYVIALPMTSRKNALIVAATTIVLLIQSPKECAYDHTSLLFSWASIAAGTHAMFSGPGRRRAILWSFTGFFASATLFFKQSTGAGIIGGWILALVYLVAAAFYERGRGATKQAVHWASHWAAGMLLGLLATWIGLVAAGTTAGAFTQAVFVDGPELKGGTWTLVKLLYRYVADNDVFRNALVPTALLIALGVRVARRSGTMHIGDESMASTALDRRTAIALSACIAAVFGTGAVLLAAEVRLLNRVFTSTVDTFRMIPGYGFVFAIAFFLAHLSKGPYSATDPILRERGHFYNAFALVALTSSLIYATSFIHFSPFYYNTPEIPLALIFLFIAIDRARLPIVSWAVFALCLLPFFGVKLNRALSADIPVDSGHWAHMRVNYRGQQLLRAAKRVQELARPNEEVLVLPEDVQLAALLRRPRPKVKGAILFVDQYPRRLLKDDLGVIDQRLPKVIVVHPRRRSDWQLLYGTWSKDSAAQAVLEHVLDDLLPKRYRLDSSYPTIFFWDQGHLDVWVRKDDSQ